MSMAFLTVPLQRWSTVPLAVLIGGVVMVALGYVVAQFATRVPLPARSTTMPRSFGPQTGFMGGWVSCHFDADDAIIAGWWLDHRILGHGVWSRVALVGVVDLCGAECVVLYLLSYFDVRISTKPAGLSVGIVAIVVLLAGY